MRKWLCHGTCLTSSKSTINSIDRHIHILHSTPHISLSIDRSFSISPFGFYHHSHRREKNFFLRFIRWIKLVSLEQFSSDRSLLSSNDPISNVERIFRYFHWLNDLKNKQRSITFFIISSEKCYIETMSMIVDIHWMEFVYSEENLM